MARVKPAIEVRKKLDMKHVVFRQNLEVEVGVVKVEVEVEVGSGGGGVGLGVWGVRLGVWRVGGVDGSAIDPDP